MQFNKIYGRLQTQLGIATRLTWVLGIKMKFKDHSLFLFMVMSCVLLVACIGGSEEPNSEADPPQVDDLPGEERLPRRYREGSFPQPSSN